MIHSWELIIEHGLLYITMNLYFNLLQNCTHIIYEYNPLLSAECCSEASCDVEIVSDVDPENKFYYRSDLFVFFFNTQNAVNMQKALFYVSERSLRRYDVYQRFNAWAIEISALVLNSNEWFTLFA